MITPRPACDIVDETGGYIVCKGYEHLCNQRIDGQPMALFSKNGGMEKAMFRISTDAPMIQQGERYFTRAQVFVGHEGETFEEVLKNREEAYWLTTGEAAA